MHIYVSSLIILLLDEACKCQDIETGAFIKFQLHHVQNREIHLRRTHLDLSFQNSNVLMHNSVMLVNRNI